MSGALFQTSDELRSLSRFPPSHAAGRHASDLVLLAGFGACAALATAFFDFNLRIPGHAIIRAVFPLALGLALAPVRGGGILMSCSAVLTTLGMHAGGITGAGVGALTSLIVTGPLLDLASAISRRGWQIYVWFAAAGLTSNLAAFVVRWAGKSGGGNRMGSRMLGDWWATAPVSYAVCGLVAGLISAAICFRATGAKRSP